MDITEEEKQKLMKLLMNAYVNLCKAEKLLKEGSDSDGKSTKPNTTST
jgi:hypothetical protein